MNDARQRGGETPQESAEPGSHDTSRSPGDDEVIAVAFRRSLLVMAGVAVAAAVGWLLLRDDGTEEVVDAVELRAPQAAPALVGRTPPELAFTDVTEAAGIGFVHESGATGERLLPETMGGGVAFLDVDDDGAQDLLFVNSSGWPGSGAAERAVSALYRNRGDGRFDDITAGSGLDVPLYGMGISVGDYDADGRVDVFLTAVGTNRLLRGAGDGRFDDVTGVAGVGGADDAWSTSAAFFDYDRDGDLDLFVANYVEWSRDLDFEVDYRLTGIGRAYGPPTNFAGTQSYLYRNEGDGTFTDVSATAGIHVDNPATRLPAGKGLAVMVDDVDGDGWLDVAVANDTVRNFLFRNRGDGTFEETGTLIGLAYDNDGAATGAMGIDGARYANDDDYAIAIGNFANEMTSFYVAPAGAGLFTDEAIVTGIGPASRRALSFGLFFFDADLDGRLDLLQANGHVENEINVVQPSQRFAQAPQLFWQCGPDCPRLFVLLESVGALAEPLVGRGAAYADVDRDGDLDVVLTQPGAPPRLLRNDQSTGHHWLRVRLQGSARHRGVIGARVRLVGPDGVQERRVMPARSYLSQVELPVTFGLGSSSAPGRLEIAWPDGVLQTVEAPPIDRELVVLRREGD